MRCVILAIFPSLLGILPAFADDALRVTGAYASVNRPNAPTGSVYMTIENPGAVDDRLLAATASVAEKVTLHSSQMSQDGMMQMLEIEDGVAVPAGGSAAFEQGADHVMLTGLTRPLAQGDRFTLDLTFETAGKVVVIVTVGDPAPDAAATDHSGHAAP